MNYQEKVAWLGRYQTALSCQRMLEEEITVLRSDAARVTACMSGMPGRSGPDADRLPRAVEHIEDAQKRLAQQLDGCMAARMEVMRGILTWGTAQGGRCCSGATSWAKALQRSPMRWAWCSAGSTSCTTRLLSGWSRKRGVKNISRNFAESSRDFIVFHNQ